VKRQLAAHFVQQLLSTLTAAWLLGREPINVPWATSTLLGRWRCSILAAYSKKYLTKLEDKQSIALQHTLDLALFDWVKVRLLDFGPEETIRDLCVSSYVAFVARGFDAVFRGSQVFTIFQRSCRFSGHPNWSLSKLCVSAFVKNSPPLSLTAFHCLYSNITSMSSHQGQPFRPSLKLMPVHHRISALVRSARHGLSRMNSTNMLHLMACMTIWVR
jgi:hypothetical protein